MTNLVGVGGHGVESCANGSTRATAAAASTGIHRATAILRCDSTWRLHLLLDLLLQLLLL